MDPSSFSALLATSSPQSGGRLQALTMWLTRISAP
uniref:Uncharacterized protein n=1 Tax=Anguilla anguilla TaxID=7936 RepID=A0A0E9RZD2_ANGAN